MRLRDTRCCAMSRSRLSRPERSSVNCCLCLKLLDSVSHQKTRKLFYGASCVNERTTLWRVLARRGLGRGNFASPKLSNSNAVLCASCSRLLVRIRSAEQELAKSLSLVDSFLGLTSHDHVANQPSNTSTRDQLTQDQETASMEMDMGQDSNQCPTISNVSFW